MPGTAFPEKPDPEPRGACKRCGWVVALDENGMLVKHTNKLVDPPCRGSGEEPWDFRA